MVFRRTGARTYAFQARLPNGRYKQLQSSAPFTAAGKALAQRIASMWESLAVEYRAWDLLEPVLLASHGERSARLGRLYDLWVSTRYNPGEMRRQLSDVDLEPYVEPYLLAHSRGVGAGSAAHVRLYLRTLIPEGLPCPLSCVTPGWLTEHLAAYEGGRSTLRFVASAWSGFFAHLTDVHGLFPANPMNRVTRPTIRRAPVAFYELETVKRIVAAQPTHERRALLAVLYATGIEVSVALRLTRADVWEASHEINAAGTKTHTRHRVASVQDWAWPIIAAYIKPFLPAARLFPAAWTPESVSQWHRYSIRRGLKLPQVLRLHSARHHWAVLNLRAGVPVAVVQHQLGHASASMTLNTYGAFLPSAADREHWRAKVTEAEAKRADTVAQ
jgi:integrase